jgi:hypothetical protein
MNYFRLILIALISLTSSLSLAGRFDKIGYGGRLAQPDGTAITGPVSLDITLYRGPTGTSGFLTTISIPTVNLDDGVFEVDLGDVRPYLTGNGDVWVEVKDVTNGEVYPRHKFVAVPYALRIPVNTASGLSWNSAGELNVNIPASAPASKISGANVSSAPPNSGEFLKYDGTNWVSAALTGSGDMLSSNNLSDLTTPATARSNLGLGTAATKNFGTGANNLVELDGSGNLPAVDGSALTNLPSPSGFTGNLAGDVTGPMGTTVVSNVGGKTAAAVGTSVDDTLAATDANTASTIVKRDATGNFTASSAILKESLKFYDDNASNFIKLDTPSDITADVVLVLPNGTGSNGDVLTTDGSGTLSWTAAGAAPVTSVNSQTGIVNLTTANVTESGNQYFTDARAQSAAVADSIADGTTDVAPSQNAVFDALALKEPSIAGGTTSQYFRGDKTWQTFPGASGAAGGSLSGTYPNPGIAASAVDSAEIANDAVTTAKILDLNVTAAKIATDAITNAKMADDAVTADEIAAGAVGTSEIADGSIDLVDIKGTICGANQILKVNGAATAVVCAADAGITAVDWTSPGTIGSAAANSGKFTIVTSNAGTNATPSYTFAGDTDTGLFSSTDQINFTTGGVQRATLGTTGLGIGINLPSADLHIYSGGDATEKIETTGASSKAFTIFKSPQRTFFTGIIDGTADTFGVYDDTAAQLRLAIKGNGRVGIGTNNPDAQLDVAGSVKIGNDAACSLGGDAGKLRYNGQFEGCDGTAWKAITPAHPITIGVSGGFGCGIGGTNMGFSTVTGGAGTCTGSFSTTFASAPVCTCSAIDTTAPLACTIQSVNSSSVTFKLETNADGYMLTCLGNP